MADIKRGPIRRSIDLFNDNIYRIVDGLCPTDGIQYSAIATFGTTAVDILDNLIDPGADLSLREIEVGLTQKFGNVKDAVGSLFYFWQIRQESVATTRAYVAFTGTYTKGIGSLASSEDTFSGYINVGSVPEAPIRIKLTATGLVASSMTGKVKNSSYVHLVGAVIPGA